MSDSDSDASIEPPTFPTLENESSPPQQASLAHHNETFEGRMYHAIYGSYDSDFGRSVSRSERKREGYISSALTYGEVLFETFAELFKVIKERHGGMPEGGVFVDVGCGIGKPVFAAALLHNFRKCVGIEILEDLYKVCVECLKTYTRDVKPQLGEEKTADLQFSFLNNDALEVDWSDADVVFMNSTCFTQSLMIDLSLVCKQLKEGTIIITTTRRVIGTAFTLLEEIQMEESWGDATVYIQKRNER
mmetsp:Transcript_10406/g.21411  ORF Transcript_10406/g.21411 Transcript_10406/m.21411 type:complete len:247 (-) Transcript_10406:21-761(-)